MLFVNCPDIFLMVLLRCGRLNDLAVLLFM